MGRLPYAELKEMTLEELNKEIKSTALDALRSVTGQKRIDFKSMDNCVKQNDRLEAQRVKRFPQYSSAKVTSR